MYVPILLMATALIVPPPPCTPFTCLYTQVSAQPIYLFFPKSVLRYCFECFEHQRIHVCAQNHNCERNRDGNCDISNLWVPHTQVKNDATVVDWAEMVADVDSALKDDTVTTVLKLHKSFMKYNWIESIKDQLTKENIPINEQHIQIANCYFYQYLVWWHTEKRKTQTSIHQVASDLYDNCVYCLADRGQPREHNINYLPINKQVHSQFRGVLTRLLSLDLPNKDTIVVPKTTYDCISFEDD